MNLTLQDVLTFPAVTAGDPQILSGADLLDRRVRWIHVAEIGDIGDMLQGGELILTTGLALVGPGADPEHFLQQLSSVGAAGLVVELSARLPEVPPPIIKDASRRRLPLIALRKTVPFVAITEAVHRRIVAHQYDHLEFAHRTHERFTSLTLTGATVTQIVTAAAELIGSPIVLEDVSHRAIAFAGMTQSQSELLRDWERRSRRTPRSDGHEAVGPEGWVTKTVGPAGNPWGRLVAVAPVAGGPRIAMVLDRTADALQLTRMIEQDHEELWVRAQESLLDDLARGRLTDEAAALSRARSLRMEPGETYLPIAVRFAAQPQGGTLHDIQEVRRQTASTSRALSSSGLSALIGQLDTRTIGLVVALRATTDEDRALARLSKALQQEGGAVAGPIIGAARASTSMITAGARLHAAEHVVDAASALALQGRRPFYRSTDVRLRGLIAQLRDDARALAFAESELGPLIAHDAENGDDLMEILQHFVACQGNKSHVAQATHRSRPAIYSKLRQIEQILDVDLGSADSILSLGVALLITDHHRRSMQAQRKL